MLESGAEVNYIPIILDATASGQQVFPLFLTLKDESLLKNLNLSEDLVWVDTYSVLMGLYVNDLIERGEEDYSRWFKEKMNRSLCKKPIMTVVYNATEYRVFETLWEPLFQGLAPKERGLAKKVISDFYNFLNKRNFERFYGVSSLLDIEAKTNISADLNYYEPIFTKDNRIKIRTNGSQRTSSYTSYTLEVQLVRNNGAWEAKDEKVQKKFTEALSNLNNDLVLWSKSEWVRPEQSFLPSMHYKARIVNKRKTNRAKAPNLAHYFDSKIAVLVITKFNSDIYTIHDEYILELRKKHRIYSVISTFFNKEVGVNGILISVII